MDSCGRVHAIPGEQGDAMMLRLFTLSQHKAVVNIQFQMRDGKALMAILDDICTVSPPDRVECSPQVVGCGLWNEADIRVHEGKIHTDLGSSCRNALFVVPSRGQQSCLIRGLWVWREEMPTHPHGMKVLHTHLVSHAQFLRLHFTHCVRTGHGTLSKCGRTTIGSRSSCHVMNLHLRFSIRCSAHLRLLHSSPFFPHVQRDLQSLTSSRTYPDLKFLVQRTPTRVSTCLATWPQVPTSQVLGAPW